uniref:Uncharacterized protein n=1 Tax=Arundo donax TaxID=35708 RepID=A0A0A9GWS1_ARUDO
MGAPGLYQESSSSTRSELRTQPPLRAGVPEHHTPRVPTTPRGSKQTYSGSVARLKH